MDLRALKLPPLLPSDKDKGQGNKGVRVAFWSLGGRCVVTSAPQGELLEASEGTVNSFVESELLSLTLTLFWSLDLYCVMR